MTLFADLLSTILAFVAAGCVFLLLYYGIRIAMALSFLLLSGIGYLVDRLFHRGPA